VRNRAVVSVIGRDQKGVVARVSTYLASCNINIEDIEQRVMEGLFIMTMLVDLSDVSCTLDELVLGLRRIGEETGMETTPPPGGRARPMRSGLPCSSPRSRTAWPS
jgi:predicted amino acid-binding ACT domain protein